MITIPELLRVEVIYRYYSVKIRVFCPYCKYKAKHKTKTYNSLKKLGHHVALEHRAWKYPVPFNQFGEMMKILAKAFELGILPYQNQYNGMQTILRKDVNRDCNEIK